MLVFLTPEVNRQYRCGGCHKTELLVSEGLAFYVGLPFSILGFAARERTGQDDDKIGGIRLPQDGNSTHWQDPVKFVQSEW